ncbi:MAG: DNA primase [Actinomycetes bacterium]
MSRFTDDDRERVRDAVDMVALVETRTQLKRSGANSFFGRCPFHEERSPSFHVRPVEKHYHCFGCQVSGDPFKFVMEMEGLSFPEAIESLADRFGVKVEPQAEDPEAVERRKRRERLLELLERTTAFYERVLADASEAAAARKLLADRGIEQETLARFRVGYSPSAWDRVLLASREAGFTEEELLAAGLVRKAQGKEQLFDRFRGRIMFPLADSRGRVIGFGARAMRDGQGPKYLNSAEGEIYHKGSQLYGLHLARPEAARSGSIVLVEGYVDALAMSQAGVENVVALMGTALTEEQAAQLERTARTLLLALDADKAGQKAMLRSGEITAGKALELRVVPMPPGKDPGDLLLEEGADRLRSRVSASEPFVAFRVGAVLSSADLSNAEGKDRALAQLRPILSAERPSVLREELLQRIAGQLDLSGELVATIVQPGAGSSGSSVTASRSPGPAPTSSGVLKPADRLSQVERGFLALCVALPERGRDALNSIDPEEWFTGAPERRAAAHLASSLPDPIGGLGSSEDSDLASLMAGLMSRASEMEPSEAAFDLEFQQLDLRRHDRLIERSRRNDPGLGSELAVERERIRQRIDSAAERLEDEADQKGIR